MNMTNAAHASWSPAAGTALGTDIASAQSNYPTRVIRVIVPSSTDGGTDILMCQFGAKLTESLGQQFLVDNRAGANGITGTDMVARQRRTAGYSC